PARGAELAGPADAAGLRRDLVTHRPSADTPSDLRDPARVLVPEDRAGPAPSLHDAVQVGAADPAIVDRDHHLARRRDGHRPVLNGDGSVAGVDRGLDRIWHAAVGS